MACMMVSSNMETKDITTITCVIRLEIIQTVLMHIYKD